MIGKKALAPLVALLSLGIALVLGEALVRAIDGYRITSLKLVRRSARAVREVAPAERAAAVASRAVPEGFEPEWFLDDPPNPRAGRSPDPELAAIWRRLGDPSLQQHSMYQWNRRHLERCACSQTCAQREIFRRIDRLFFFTSLEPTTHPAFRHLQSAYLPNGLVTNSFGWRSPEIALDKPPATIRLAFVGASTTVSAYGLPFSYPEHIGHWLERWARAQALPLRFEVINAGRSGIGSGDIAAIVREELVAVEPDLVIYYEGSNQFWPTAFVTWSEEPVPPPRIENVRRDSRWAESSAIYHRSVSVLDRYFRRPGHEPRKARHVVAWPADLDEADPDLAHPLLPLNLPAILADLDSIQASLSGIGSELVPVSFVWLVEEGMVLDLARHRSIYDYLNGTFGQFTYAHMRRMADFQNRVLAKHAERRGLGFIDLAAEFPRDPDLFLDAIHQHPAGIRLRAWLVARELIPMLRRRIASGQLPRPDRERLTIHPAFTERPEPTVTWQEVRAACAET